MLPLNFLIIFFSLFLHVGPSEDFYEAGNVGTGPTTESSANYSLNKSDWFKNHKLEWIHFVSVFLNYPCWVALLSIEAIVHDKCCYCYY